MIVLWGLVSDTPLQRVLTELRRLGEAVTVFDQWSAAAMDVELTVAGSVGGHVRVGGRTVYLDTVTALYARPYDWTWLCTERRLKTDDPDWRHVAAVEEAIHTWWAIMPGIVVNPPSAMASNESKPYQLTLIRNAGMNVPDTLVTTDPAAAQQFWERHGTVVYKSVSGIRSRVAKLTPRRAARLVDVAWCPTQFQEYIPGSDVRVHVVGDEIFATEVLSEATDYRYAHAELAGEPELRPYLLSDEVSQTCVALARALGLPMAGIDLRRRPDGKWFCLEVNPSPGFTYYEFATGQPISEATARLLSGRHSPMAVRPELVPLRERKEGTAAIQRAGRPFICSDERPDVGRAAIDDLLGRFPPSTDRPT